MKPVAILLAAGKGTRMRSELPKVLTPVCERPMIEYPLTAVRFAGVERILVIVGYRAEMVQEALKDAEDVEFVTQTEQKGTGHAVRMCVPALRRIMAENPGVALPVVVAAGDSPLMQGETIAELLTHWEKEPSACLLGTIVVENPYGLGRILRDAEGNFVGIVEEKDANDEQRKIREVNQSYYVFDAVELVDALDALTPNNAQGEYYLTDVPAIMLSRGKNVQALSVLRPIEAISVNTPEERTLAENAMRKYLEG